MSPTPIRVSLSCTRTEQSAGPRKASVNCGGMSPEVAGGEMEPVCWYRAGKGLRRERGTKVISFRCLISFDQMNAALD